MSQAVSRNHCFTLNNYVDADLVLLQAIRCRFMLYGKELSPSTQTRHLQGLIVFANAKSFSAVKAILPAGCHIEMMHGSIEQNIVYCSKEGDVTETGDRPLSAQAKGEKGKSLEIARWTKARDAAMKGEFDHIDADIMVRCYRTLKEIRKDYMVKAVDLDYLPGIWFHGCAGSGKSRTARRLYPNAYFKCANKWWDGFQGEEFIILDDIGLEHSALGHHLKIWSDRYSFIAEVKGGALHIRPKVLLVTSQYSIDQLWPDSKETQEALRRRFTCVAFPTFAGFDPSGLPHATIPAREDGQVDGQSSVGHENLGEESDV